MSSIYTRDLLPNNDEQDTELAREQPSAIANHQICSSSHGLQKAHTPSCLTTTMSEHQPTAMKEANSTFATSGLSLLAALSSYSSSLQSSIAGGLQQGTTERKLQQLRRRPCQSNLQDQHHSTPEPLLDHLPAIPTLCTPKTPTRKRYIHVKPPVLPQSPFTSPDRYTALRHTLEPQASPIRTVHSHNTLKNREKYERRQDDSTNPFRNAGERRSRLLMRQSPLTPNQYARTPHYAPSFVDGNNANPVQSDTYATRALLRNMSFGTVWTMGGISAAIPLGQLHGVETGGNAMLTSGSSAPMVHTNFVDSSGHDYKVKAHERRLALALQIDQARRILPVMEIAPYARSQDPTKSKPIIWQDTCWTRLNDSTTLNGNRPYSPAKPEKAVPSVAFRVLDAPRLKDDYYCSVLAYSNFCRTLAVALTHRVYLWTEQSGVRYPPIPPVRPANYVMSLAFSSDAGGRGILATGRSSGHVTLFSVLEERMGFDLTHPAAACCVSFRPIIAYRRSSSSDKMAECEDLIVGDDAGQLYYYSIEWPDIGAGSAILLLKLEAHSQNICGLAWSPDGRTFVSGGNDNAAALFIAEEIILTYSIVAQMTVLALSGPNSATAETPTHDSRLASVPTSTNSPRIGTDAPDLQNLQGFGSRSFSNMPRQTSARDQFRVQFSSIGGPPTPPRSPQGRLQTANNNMRNVETTGMSNMQTYVFRHSAAVKAIAFAPWQPTLLATGGGSNDRQIHFHHTESGSTLAVINVFAQVTSLIWSTTRREIAATFGYAQPEHEIRIAVFAWPSCECVVKIPWERKSNGEIGRALWAIPYPGGPNDTALDLVRETNGGLEAWQATQRRARRGRAREVHGIITPETSPERIPGTRASPQNVGTVPRSYRSARREGDSWASRTEEEGSLIVACCDQTVKFFEVWAGKSKGRSRGLGSKSGVLGGSKVLEGWCEGVGVEEVGQGEETIR